MLPTPGTIVTVTTEYFSPNYWGDIQHNEITGEVMKSPKWLTAQQLRLPLNGTHAVIGVMLNTMRPPVRSSNRQVG